jgi:arylsulfatase A-like enzyme
MSNNPHSSRFSRRDILKVALASGVSIALASSTASVFAQPDANEVAPKRKRPNFLIILIDDLGYQEASCYCEKNPPFLTPNIDRIAKNGIRMTDGYVTAPICAPSRAAIVTGRYQQRFGFYDNTDAGTGLPKTEKSFGDYLKSAGYVTGMVGKWHLGWDESSNPVNRGFDEFFGFVGGLHDYFKTDLGHDFNKGQAYQPILKGLKPVETKKYLTYEFTDRAIDFIQRNSKQPFCLYLPYNAIHSPEQAPRKYLERFNNGKTGFDRKSAMISCLDDQIGRLTDTISKLGIEKDTIIFFLSDNGGVYNQPLRAGKGSFYEGGMRVPFIISWPGTLPSGKVYTRPVVSMDIMATMLGLSGAGLPGDREFDGVNLVDFLTGKNCGAPHDVLHWASTQWVPKAVVPFAIRKGKWKLLRQGQAENGYELYDLESDIGEKQNVFEQHKDIAAELIELHRQWYSSMPAPILPPGKRDEPWVQKIQKEYGDKWVDELNKTYQRWNDESLLNHD